MFAFGYLDRRSRFVTRATLSILSCGGTEANCGVAEPLLGLARLPFCSLGRKKNSQSKWTEENR
jgi:hypothetical protein